MRGADRPLAAAPLIVLATVALYWPARGAGFVGDDFMILHRLRALEGLPDVLRFFRGEFFEYYRPLGFVSHAFDWFAAGADPGRFHLTNILLHAVAAVFVLLIGHRLSPGSLAGPVAALLFALHAASHEAVVWISARFDLLATAFSVSAICWFVRRWPGDRWVPAVLFFLALLSKESSVALPMVVAAWSTFILRGTLRETTGRLAPWLGALAAYGVLRQIAGGVSAVGGPSRLPKLVALIVGIAVLALLADGRWLRVRAWAAECRIQAALFAMAGLAGLAAAATFSSGPLGDLAREKLSVAGFALFYLTTPVLDRGQFTFSDPSTSLYWIGGAAGLAMSVALVLWFWKPLLASDRLWFLGAVLVATLLPISALTEGTRYLYLPSAAFSLLIALVVSELRWRWRRVALGVVGLLLAVSALQVSLKIRDWVWAGAMTAEAARLVDARLAPSCGEGRVIFLTSPVGIRGVYTHFYYETFELARGCQPEVFQVIARAVKRDVAVDVVWDDLGRIVITAPDYRGEFVLSRDLRHFDVPLRPSANATLQTPAGTVEARAGAPGHPARLRLTPAAGDAVRYFYYSQGLVHALPQPAMLR